MRLTLVHLAILTPFVFALFVPLLFRVFRQIHTGWFVILVPASLFSYFATYLFLSPDVTSQPIRGSLPWIATLDLHLAVHLDGLALLFALIITGIGFLVVLYSIYYMSIGREALDNFYMYLLLFMGAMLGVVLSDNLIALYSFWEITSVSSFLLIAYWYQRKNARYGAHKSMMITIFGGFAMLFGFIFLYTASGTFSLTTMIGMVGEISEHALFIPAMLLILLGAFTKSAQFPFHIWLPDAMEAPTPISAYLHSATMVKAGIYLVARLTPLFGGQTQWFLVITIVGLITLLWGSFMAVRQHDLKAMLAFSTVSQLGMIMSLVGIGSTALTPAVSHEVALVLAGGILAALFHLVNHSIFKGSLFMVIGILDHETGTRDIRRLSGLMTVMPISFSIAVVGAFSMAGLPPFSGFLSKELFFSNSLNVARAVGSWAVLVPYVAWVASTLTFVYCMILAFRAFTGPYQIEMLDKPPREAPPGMLLAPSVLAVLVVVFFIYPNWLVNTVLQPAMQSVLPGLIAPGQRFHAEIQVWHGWTSEILMTIGIVVVGSFLYAYLPKWSIVYDLLPSGVSLNNMYSRGLLGAENVAGRITKTYMTGLLRDYMSYIFVVIIGLVGGALIALNAFAIDISSNSDISVYEFILGIAVVAAAILVVLSNSRLVSIVALSAVGLIICLFYVIFRAPDLALTQLVVETISTALFLLCFYFLPKMREQTARVRLHAGNALIALGVGTTLTLVGLSAQGYRLLEPISHFFEDSYLLAGALNIVNALLVDFRGFDTMLEIVVLFCAGIGVFALVKLRPSGRKGD